MGRTFEFGELENATLIVDALYKGGQNNYSGEPLPKLFNVGLDLH